MLSVDVSDKFLRNLNTIYVPNVCVEEGMADFGPFYDPNNVLWGSVVAFECKTKIFQGFGEKVPPLKKL